MKLALLIITLVLSCYSCGSQSFDDFREEGEGVTRSMITEFKGIQTRQQLIEAKPKLCKLFDKLVDVMIASHDYRNKHPEAEPSATAKSQILSDQLRTELNRVYGSIEGGREIIEKCQEPALHRLDAYTKRSLKHRQQESIKNK